MKTILIWRRFFRRRLVGEEEWMCFRRRRMGVLVGMGVGGIWGLLRRHDIGVFFVVLFYTLLYVGAGVVESLFVRYIGCVVR